jgi:mono/diheme cytochrome c family protein
MKTLLLSCTIFATLGVGFTALAAGQTLSQAPAGNVENGKKLYGKDGCYQCHGWEGQGGFAGVRIAPNPLTYSAFVRYVRAPRGVMPAYTEKLLKSEQDLADIYAYLKSRPAPVPLSSLPSN